MQTQHVPIRPCPTLSVCVSVRKKNKKKGSETVPSLLGGLRLPMVRGIILPSILGCANANVARSQFVSFDGMNGNTVEWLLAVKCKRNSQSRYWVHGLFYRGFGHLQALPKDISQC